SARAPAPPRARSCSRYSACSATTRRRRCSKGASTPCRDRAERARSALVVSPPILHAHPVAVLRAVGADRDQLQTVGARLEAAHGARRHAYHIPAAQVHDVIVELDPPRAAQHHVGLLLLAVVVAERRAEARAEAEVAHAEVLGVDMRAREARLDVRPALGGAVLD